MGAPDLRRQAGPHVFVDDLEAPRLAPEDEHHLVRSLRLRIGDPLTISDGQGRWRGATFASMPEPTSEIHEVLAPPWPVTLAIALAKGTKPETAVQKATELGIDRIIIFHGVRSVPRWDRAKQAKARERLARVAHEAAMQSRRVRLPAVDFAEDLAALVAAPGSEGLVRADFGGTPLHAGVRTVVVGPEGGWDQSEIDLVEATVDLGPTVLRAETAAIVAAAGLAQVRTGR